MKPTLPAGFKGFIFDSKLGEAEVAVLVNVDDDDDPRHPPEPPQAVSVWINGTWVDLDEIGSLYLIARLDDEATKEWQRMIDEGRLDSISSEDSDV